MKEFVFNKQNINGSFEMQSDSSYSTSHIVNEIDNYTLNAYITWALSEAYPEDSRLEKSIEYLENGLDEITDNYTLALVANVFANTNQELSILVRHDYPSDTLCDKQVNKTSLI